MLLKKRNLLLTLLLAAQGAFAGNDILPWAQSEFKISYEKLLKNISPMDNGKRLSGVVLASPSRQDPDYYFHWTRDAALVMRTLFHLKSFATPKHRENIDQSFKDFVAFTKLNQASASGQSPWEIGNLGEPKFYVTGGPYRGPWGRPQNDGPGLRALVLSEFALYLLDKNNAADTDYVKKELYRATLIDVPVVKKDLEYVAHNWKISDFDLWEEIQGTHFFTRIVQFHGLTKGAELAKRLGDTEAHEFYTKEARAIAGSLKDFWSEEKGFFNATINRVGGIDHKKSNLDVAPLLALTYMQAGNPRVTTFSNSDDRLVSQAYSLMREFSKVYVLNQNTPEMAPAIGRYPEDVYDGNGLSQGNPWFIATLGLAEYNYRLAKAYRESKSIELTQRNLPYLKNLAKLSADFSSLNTLSAGSISKRDPRYAVILKALVEQGDQFLKRVKAHAFENGSMSEQMNRNTGFNQGARDLTWNYAAFLSTMMARFEVQ